jgi:ATP-dependent Clp protease ATP-binding subunit ClpA
VKSTLARVRNERSGQAVLSPAFLARLKRIIIFRPLDEQALLGICRNLVRQMQKNWKQQRDKALVVPEELMLHIAKQAQIVNEKSGNREGGRSVRRLMVDLIEAPIERAAAAIRQEFKACSTIELTIEPGDATPPHVRVGFLA